MSALGARRFFEAMASLLQKSVVVQTTSGKKYSGLLDGFDPQTLSLCLSDVREEGGKVLTKLFLTGNVVAQISSTEKPFDFKKLAERLERVFPKFVKFDESALTILVMDKIRITEEGVVEGSGPAAERAKKVYEEFMKELLEAK